jgi:hypothetical protein
MKEINVNVYFKEEELISILWAFPEWIDIDKYNPQENEIGMFELNTESSPNKKINLHFIKL